LIRRTGWLAALVVGLAGMARAGDTPAAPENRLTVIVQGKAETPATAVELELTVSGQAEEASEADIKHREKLRRVLAAVRGEKDEKPRKKVRRKDDEDEDGPPPKEKRQEKDENAPDLEKLAAAISFEVTERGFHVVTSKKEDPDDPTKAVSQGARFESKVVVTAKGLEKIDPAALHRRLAELLDVGVASGADGLSGDGEPPVVRFLCADAEDLKKKAYGDAITRARSRAGAIAGLSDRKLGRVIVVKEAPAPAPLAMIEVPKAEEKKNTFEVQSVVDLEVTFALD
jgi:uncharacterized protein YggE